MVKRCAMSGGSRYAREGSGPPRWRAGAELQPVGERLQSPYDPEAHYSTKRQTEWSGYHYLGTYAGSHNEISVLHFSGALC